MKTQARILSHLTSLLTPVGTAPLSGSEDSLRHNCVQLPGAFLAVSDHHDPLKDCIGRGLKLVDGPEGMNSKYQSRLPSVGNQGLLLGGHWKFCHCCPFRLRMPVLISSVRMDRFSVGSITDLALIAIS